MSKKINGFIELVNTYETNFSEDELKAIVSSVYDLFKEIQDLLPDRFPKKEISERKFKLDYWNQISTYDSGISIWIHSTSIDVRISVRKDGIYHNVDDRGGSIYASDLYLYLQNKERILNFVKECKFAWEQAVNEEMKIFSSNLPKKESANSYFEKVFHNTGKTLKSVVKDMQNKGYSKSDIVSAILNVLGDVNWND